MPDGYAPYANQALGREGKNALRKWVRDGGRLVTWQDGIRVAIGSGVSTKMWGKTNAAAPGTLVRTTVDQSQPTRGWRRPHDVGDVLLRRHRHGSRDAVAQPTRLQDQPGFAPRARQRTD